MNAHDATAVLLAAGCARRLEELTRDRPKCLLEVGGRTLIEHQIQALREAGVEQVVVVVGFRAEMIRDLLGDSVRFVLNEVYDRTNSLYSLNLALPACSGPLILTNADVLFHPRLMKRLVDAPEPDALLFEPNTELGDEEMKVRLHEGRVLAMSKSLEAGSYEGENLGLLKFSPAGVKRVRLAAEDLIGQEQVNAWAPMAFDAICREYPIHGISCGTLPWIEIDFPEDLERARNVIWPRIAASLDRETHSAGMDQA